MAATNRAVVLLVMAVAVTVFPVRPGAAVNPANAPAHALGGTRGTEHHPAWQEVAGAAVERLEREYHRRLLLVQVKLGVERSNLCTDGLCVGCVSCSCVCDV